MRGTRSRCAGPEGEVREHRDTTETERSRGSHPLFLYYYILGVKLSQCKLNHISKRVFLVVVDLKGES